MSLINKMLQDLDARGQPSGETMQSSVKSVVRHERRLSAPVVAGLAVLALAVGLGGVFGWRYFKRPAPAPRVVAIAPPVVSAPAQAAPAVASQSAGVAAPMLPVGVAAPAPLAASQAPNLAAPAMTAVSLPASVAAAAAPPVVQSTAALQPPAAASPAASARASGDEAPVLPARKSRKEKRAEKARLAAEKKAAAKKAAATAPAPKAVARAAASAPAAGKQLNVQQRAESEYRRALTSLSEGRGAEAVAALEQSLQIDPRHEAARQTLVGLLIENKRQDDAIRQLQLGLTLDPRQPAMAMLLARLQIERGASGIDTLTRTLPYAAGNGEYHAFLAGALQREQRHREAAEQYQQALRSGPQNGVWWMGLGISLQAEKRNAEALEAFQKSKASGTLTPDLLAFVERKLQQFSR